MVVAVANPNNPCPLTTLLRNPEKVEPPAKAPVSTAEALTEVTRLGDLLGDTNQPRAEPPAENNKPCRAKCG